MNANTYIDIVMLICEDLDIKRDDVRDIISYNSKEYYHVEVTINSDISTKITRFIYIIRKYDNVLDGYFIDSPTNKIGFDLYRV